MTHVPKVGSDFRIRKSSPVFDPVCLQPYSCNTLNSGARTAAPALPYSNALMSCGKILSLQNDVGKESSDDGRLLKKLLFAS